MYKYLKVVPEDSTWVVKCTYFSPLKFFFIIENIVQFK